MGNDHLFKRSVAERKTFWDIHIIKVKHYKMDTKYTQMEKLVLKWRVFLIEVAVTVI
ncbi:hypothetical protein [Heyndrickxia oleronia]|jgi:hypothetical protein|uniref:hypothetical protein n=1 Tax=Heyndrickxia oleronia TaxID=38875 RepID=UPI000A56849D|nr:hypothetical protein [Heyndrickxia oleronia]NYV67411.1 hypothetical protein [Bacillus sp. Gen3]MCI1591487.1 hypothetical protein [Heyndrickxia oleronia]MCI1614377.1 hypothetical protein [Heyndrickxia oleronia]MCI1745451.1 hypothetical protein [Heyndrickxia oleronia]MCI1762258.1 hypothetical protein [Heyndrickxia oleronia]